MSNYSSYKIVRQLAVIIDTRLRNPYFLFRSSGTLLSKHSCYKVRTSRIREEEVSLTDLPLDARNHFYYLLSNIIKK